jgi:restriction endonuclease S subunit
LKTTFGYVTSIHTGVYAKTSLTGDTIYLQVKDFDHNGQIQPKLEPNLVADESTYSHLLNEDDILLAAKGTKNIVAKYQSALGPAVASTSFFVVRLNKYFHNQLLPDYLVWWLNQPQIQSYLKGQAVGSNLPSISKGVLQDLEIYVPSLSIQEGVLRIQQLRNQEKKLKHQIEELKDQQIQQILKNAIKT